VALAVGLLVAPPKPMRVPPETAKVLLSQSKPSSGAVVPSEMIVPPEMAMVPLLSKKYGSFYNILCNVLLNKKQVKSISFLFISNFISVLPYSLNPR
jgi:hypothetical protein